MITDFKWHHYVGWGLTSLTLIFLPTFGIQATDSLHKTAFDYSAEFIAGPIREFAQRTYDDSQYGREFYENIPRMVSMRDQTSDGSIWEKVGFYFSGNISLLPFGWYDRFTKDHVGSVCFRPDDKKVIVSYHGSYWYHDWLIDAQFRLVDAAEVLGLSGGVHYGFSHIVRNSYISMIHSLILALDSANVTSRDYHKLDIIFTGHSLGGALSLLGGIFYKNSNLHREILRNEIDSVNQEIQNLDSHDDNYSFRLVEKRDYINRLERGLMLNRGTNANVKVINFSSPRVGDNTFGAYVNHFFGQEHIIQFRCDFDVVPRIPLIWPGNWTYYQDDIGHIIKLSFPTQFSTKVTRGVHYLRNANHLNALGEVLRRFRPAALAFGTLVAVDGFGAGDVAGAVATELLVLNHEMSTQDVIRQRHLDAQAHFFYSGEDNTENEHASTWFDINTNPWMQWAYKKFMLRS